MRDHAVPARGYLSKLRDAARIRARYSRRTACCEGAHDMKRMTCEVDTVVKAIGAVAKDTARTVDMEFALH